MVPRRHRIALLLLLAATLPAPAAVADDGDPAGWSVRTDPRKRAFLVATDRAGGPRLLTIACLRDAESFGLYAIGLPGLNGSADGVRLTLGAGGATFAVTGSISPDPMSNAPSFSHDDDIEGPARNALAGRLLPVLKASGPLVVTVGDGPPREIPLADRPPLKGIATPLATFEKICFGR
ncbi:hypothetical protein [Pinisolibacter aquiterrae]|uniref:hypothetical protein n=1 Tax=Pinisolibacter aquiterrae TaxID=2815579 RepID=UPI001C3D0D66|nr:hypothetical protein [Pinisolibacter aquiterrae]MBV5264022.1 hypothetical protein [Pinisolibacter aquiterrae]MCC8233883.1 hypothetical protein [Pinisolibacter aquiterrae]